jgi:hypothetical protein
MKLDLLKNNSESKWHEYIQLLKKNDNIHNEILENIVKEFQTQLLKDEILMNNDDIISDCCIFAPRKRSVLQKKYNLSKKISRTIFKEITNEIHATIHYHRLIAKLTNYYIDQEEIFDELEIPSESDDVSYNEEILESDITDII